ncbi:MAG: imidazolonepropionase [Actinobacteria bacterium]|nr:imidazolonepropionase [Actinomycetota bacterium]
MGERGAAVAAALVTASGPLPARGAAAPAAAVPDAGLAWDDEGMIVYAGPSSGLPWPARVGSPETGCLVPGFVDCHVHLPFFGWRSDEFEARLRGVSYRELHGEEGGIFRSSRMLAEAPDERVLAFCQRLVAEMAASGTTALELKTGYGLSVEAELRQARLARALAERAPQTCTVTLLACHAVPKGLSRAEWVAAACEELIPAAAAEELADAVDVYVEDIAFSLEDLERVAEAAAAARLPLRVHADQLGPSAAAEAAVRLGARSADHLNHLSRDGVEALGAAEATVAGLLPASTFFLRAPAPPVAALREAGAAIAIATDFNPGTSPVCSMPEAIAMACTVYGLEPLVALTASTANPAWVLGLGDRLGTLEPGKRADFLLLEEAGFAQVPYRPGHDPVVATFVGGRHVAGRVLH